MRLQDLPDDVLIPIFGLCDIDSLFALRLVSRSIRAVIDTYISCIAPAVARATFPSSPLLKTPVNGHSLKWLRGLIPAQLAAIILDKDKLRRHSYINAGFPYGIPFESDCLEALYWRSRVANGWRVLRCFYLISRDVYSKAESDLGRPKMFRKASSSMRASNIWQTMSCPYQACTEHGFKQLFDTSRRRASLCQNTCRRNSEGEMTEEVRRRERLVLKKRLEHLKSLGYRDVMDYLYLWRLLFWCFRPYRRPETTVAECMDGKWERKELPQTNWNAEISNILLGSSWLNFWVLQHGTSPFWRQWWPQPRVRERNPNCIRDHIWEALNERTHHQIELEREHIAKFEFALRKRCLSPGRLKRLDDEIADGRVVNSISLDIIHWSYDLPPIVNRSPCAFPWHTSGEWLWMTGDTWVMVGGHARGLTAVISKESPNMAEDDDRPAKQRKMVGRGVLEQVPYLAYLGVEDGEKVWGRSNVGTMEMVF